jgi:arylamine N-acetyltransferase
MVHPLVDGFESEAIAPRRIRLQKRAIAETYARTSEEAQKLWCYDFCRDPAAEEKVWVPAYCFTETEYLPQDYEMMSFFTSNSPTSFFTYSVLCTRLLMGEDGNEVVGDVTLFNDRVRKTVGGKHEEVWELKTEEERVRVLKEVLDVELTDEERVAIRPERRLW